jgi:hypothetical protein
MKMWSPTMTLGEDTENKSLVMGLLIENDRKTPFTEAPSQRNQSDSFSALRTDVSELAGGQS